MSTETKVKDSFAIKEVNDDHIVIERQHRGEILMYTLFTGYKRQGATQVDEGKVVEKKAEAEDGCAH